MKSIITILSLIVLTFTSCTSNEDTSQNQENSILPKKIINIEGSISETTTITYNGNKILEINSADGHKSVYTYTSDLITNVKSSNGDTFSSSTNYTYENNILRSNSAVITSKNPTTGITTVSHSKTVYIYNTDGTITGQEYSVNPQTAEETKTENSTTYTFANGNLTQTVHSYTSAAGNTIQNYIYVYEFDNKRNPAINILGLNKIEFGSTSSLNNITKRTNYSQTITNGIAGTASTPKTINYTLLYNDNNFLTESKYSNTNSNNTLTTFTEQFFYE